MKTFFLLGEEQPVECLFLHLSQPAKECFFFEPLCSSIGFQKKESFFFGTPMP
jgi:hypothetical protein